MQLRAWPVTLTGLVNVLLAAGLLYREWFLGREEWWFGAAYALFLLFLLYRAHRLKLRVANLVEAAAQRCGLGRVDGKRRRVEPPAKPEPEPTATMVSPGAAGETAASGVVPPRNRPLWRRGTVVVVSPQPEPAARQG